MCSICNKSSSFISHWKYYLPSMCLVHPPILQLLAQSMSPLLSISNNTGNFTLSSNDCITWIIYKMSGGQVTHAFNSASVTYRHTNFCVLLLNMTGFSCKMTPVSKILLQFLNCLHSQNQANHELQIQMFCLFHPSFLLA